MHPGAFEEPPRVIVRAQGLAVFVQDDDFARGFGQRRHAGVEPGHARAKRGCIADGFLVGRIVAVVAVLLQLPAPDAAEVEVVLAVVVVEHRRVDRIGARDGLGFGDERTFGVVGGRHADAEQAIGLLGREVQVIAALPAGGVRRPHLPVRPGHVAHMQGDAAVDRRALGRIHPQHVIVLHDEMAAVVVEGRAAIDVVGRIEVQAPVEHVRGRVGGIEAGDQRRGNRAGGQAFQFGSRDCRFCGARGVVHGAEIPACGGAAEWRRWPSSRSMRASIRLSIS